MTYFQQNEIEQYLNDIDESVPQDLDDEIYDEAKQYIKVCYLNGIKAQMCDGGYFDMLTPKLKNKLTFEILDNYYQKFFYFFNDIEGLNFAETNLIRKILVHLDCTM